MVDFLAADFASSKELPRVDDEDVKQLPPHSYLNSLLLKINIDIEKSLEIAEYRYKCSINSMGMVILFGCYPCVIVGFC